MARKNCLTCDGQGFTHIPPCFWDPARPWDGIMHNPPPSCGCVKPRCTNCAGTGVRSTLPESGRLVAVRATLLYGAPADPFFVMVYANQNYWTGRLTPVTEGPVPIGRPFEAFFQLAMTEVDDQVVAGSVWPLFYPKRIGQMEVL